MCRPAALIYTCNHRFHIGTPSCVYRQRIKNCPELLSTESELQLQRQCETDSKKGIDAKVQHFKCGRCEYQCLSQSDDSEEHGDEESSSLCY